MAREHQHPEVERLDAGEVRRRVAAGRALIVDVRRSDAYAAGHIGGATSVPAGAVVARRHRLPHDRELILY